MTTDGLIVQKYGGSSLDSPRRIREIASKIAARARQDTPIIVTVSAMGKSTDELLKLANEISTKPLRRELDMLLTVGERISMALLSMALNAIGCRAISFTGSQSGIVTNVSHTRATIEEIRADRIKEALADGVVVIVAGFQGVSRSREITTLGRGGSDTTAVALAAALGAACCEIYSDFPGVCTADPRVVANASTIPALSYEEMLELAALGAKVLHYRAAEIARRFAVPLVLLSSFGDEEATRVSVGSAMEDLVAKSVTCNRNAALIRIVEGGSRSRFFELLQRLASDDVRVVLFQNDTSGDEAAAVMVVDREDVGRITDALEDFDAGVFRVTIRNDVASVSVVGSGFASGAGAIAKVADALLTARIPVLLTAKSTCSITSLVSEGACDAAVRALHRVFFESEPPESAERR